MTAPAPDPPTRDPSRQPERTRLSWHRTMLTVTVVAMLAGRQALPVPLTTARLLVVAALAAGWLLVLAAGSRRAAAMSAEHPPPPRWSVRVAALVGVGYAALGLALVAPP